VPIDLPGGQDERKEKDRSPMEDLEKGTGQARQYYFEKYGEKT
jgi:hypothetical protein